MKKIIVDAHAHVLPESLRPFLTGSVRDRAKNWFRPLSGALHEAQVYLRLIPAPARKGIDWLSALAPLPSLLLESTPEDLKAAMDAAGVHASVIIAHPPAIPNEFILELALQDARFIPAVYIPAGTPKPGEKLKEYADQGAKLLKIHPAADGEGPESARYQKLLASASELEMPVILHTGCIHSHLLYKDPEQGRAERFVAWFKEYPETRFILAHMNMHEPQIALDLAEEYPNLWVDTSWQPSEVIGEAVRRIGAERVLFGSDWPLVGHNISVGLKRVQEAVEVGFIRTSDADLILGENAVKLLSLKDASRA